MLLRRAFTGLMVLLMGGSVLAPAFAESPAYPPDRPPVVSTSEDLEHPHIIVFNVAVPPEIIYSDLKVELQRLGESRDVELVDDGSSPEDAPYDGVFSGRDLGEKSRYVQVTLVATDTEAQEETLYTGLVRTENKRATTVSFQVGTHPWGETAYIVAGAYPGSSSRIAEGLPLITAFGWTALLLIYVGILATRRQ